MAHVIQERKASLAMLKVDYVEGKPETYALPLTFAAGGRAVEMESALPQTIVARLHMNGDEGVLYDALWDKSFSLGLLGAIANHRHFTGWNGDIEASPTHAFRHLLPSVEEVDEPAIMKAEQSNTSVVYGNRLILKLFRRLEEGINPDLEVGRFLTERGFAHIPPVAGALEYRRSGGEPVTLAILQGFVFNQGDAWGYTLGALSQYFERVLAKEARIEGVPVPDKNLIVLTEEALTPLAAETIGAYLEAARLLGQRTGELHVTLAEGSDDANFAPEPFSDSARQDIYRGMVALVDQIFPLLRQHLTDLPEAVRENAQSVLGRESEIRKRFALIRDTHLTAMRIRCHGDYHLGQVLYTGKDFVIIDFEGEPARPLRERRLKGSALRDVAGMLRSFHYAAYVALIGKVAGVLVEDFTSLEGWARFWSGWVSAAFLKQYLVASTQAPFLPKNREEIRTLLEAHLLEKAVYELGYELNNRPDWVKIPLRGILDLLETVK